jgi:nitroimidazol reductase NimA-like FMN-containing flavoprotein (pyridoxamine 5'-phosphate oxidase superfamily)
MDLIEPRTGMQMIDRDGCLELLLAHQQGIGRLALVEGNKPTIMPVNYAMVDDRIVFRTGPGSKLDAAWRMGAVAFEVDRIDHEVGSGWSVVVRGRADLVTDHRQLVLLGRTALEPSIAGTDTWVMIHPETITGRRVVISRPFPS